jgi:hypothetical protein
LFDHGIVVVACGHFDEFNGRIALFDGCGEAFAVEAEFEAPTGFFGCVDSTCPGTGINSEQFLHRTYLPTAVSGAWYFFPHAQVTGMGMAFTHSSPQ